MNRWRLTIMLLGPIPILTGSFLVTSWIRPAWSPPMRNVALATEPTSSPPIIHGSLETACRAAAVKLRERLGPGCDAIDAAPFVLAGNLSTAQLQKWHRGTIAPAAKALANCYFRTSPTAPITVLLFSDEKNYQHYTKQLFGEEGISVYGYYKPRDRMLVMNIGTGGGTLVHELTHALVDFDYPQVPDWFNEGFASLHEQCQFRDDSQRGPWIEGLVNWRLPGLLEAIRQGRLRTLESLIASDDFRTGDTGLNYAQARYFCFYLQQQQLLGKFYVRLRERGLHDRLGVETTREILGGKSWRQIDADFQKWVQTLTSQHATSATQ